MSVFIWTIIGLCSSACFGIWLCQAQDLPLPVRIATACYGHGDLDRDFLSPVCVINERIAMRYVKHGSKLRTSLCPPVLTANDTSIAQCCSIEDTDCHFQLSHNQTRNYFQECSGLSTCSVRVGREQILETGSCNVSEHMELSNYMAAEYYCVPESSILQIENTGDNSIPSLFLSHHSYPNPMSTHPEYVCHISVCAGQVDLIALDLQIGCDQHISLVEDFVVTNITCDDNNLYTIRSILVSESNHVALTVPSALAGQFWFYISASSSQNVTVECGSSDLQFTSGVCPSAFSSASADTSEFLPSTLSTLDLSFYGSDPEPSQIYFEQFSSQVELSSSNVIVSSSPALSYDIRSITSYINFNTPSSIVPSQTIPDFGTTVQYHFSSYNYVLDPSHTSDTSVKGTSITSLSSMTSDITNIGRSSGFVSSALACDHEIESGSTSVLSSFIDDSRLSVASLAIKPSRSEDFEPSAFVSTTRATTFPPISTPTSNTGPIIGGIVSTILVLLCLLLAAIVVKRKCFKIKIEQTSPEDGNKVDDQQESDSEMFFKTRPSVANQQIPPVQTSHLPVPSSSNRLPPLPVKNHGTSPRPVKTSVSIGEIDDSIIESLPSNSINPEPNQKFNERLLPLGANLRGTFQELKKTGGSWTAEDESVFDSSQSKRVSEEPLLNVDTPFSDKRRLPSLITLKNVQKIDDSSEKKKKKKKKHKKDKREEEATKNLNQEEEDDSGKMKRKKKKKKKKKSKEHSFKDDHSVNIEP